MFRMILHCCAVLGVLAQDQPGCETEAQEDLLSQLQSKVSVALPHDDSFNECDSAKPEPPTVGIFASTYPGQPSRFDGVDTAKVIVDIGGNVGDDVNLLVQKHPNARIFTFEPIPDLFQKLQGRFAGNSNVLAQNFGIADGNAGKEFVLEGPSGFGTVAAGLDHGIAGKHVKVNLRDVHEVLSWVQKQTGQVPDLLSMNCEGCEYAVMQRMAQTGWLAAIPNVQLSWHVAADIKDRVKKRCDIEKLLWQSHTRQWKSSFGWVGWQSI